MPAKGKRQVRKCLHCDSQVMEKVTNGVNKGYLKTCAAHFNSHRVPGPTHPNARKQGRIETPQGYVYVLNPLRERCQTKKRYVAEHRLVVSQALGRELMTEEVVHHLNGIRNDNRIENLVLLGPNEEHESRTLTKAIQRRVTELEALLLSCSGAASDSEQIERGVKNEYECQSQD